MSYASVCPFAFVLQRTKNKLEKEGVRLKTVHAGDAIDKSRFNMFHLLLIFWGFFIILVDGYDVVIYGSIVPSLIEEWSISSVTAGAIGSYTVMGTVVGAVFFGYLADKVGVRLSSVFLLLYPGWLMDQSCSPFFVSFQESDWEA